jgi:O-antigen ligase
VKPAASQTGRKAPRPASGSVNLLPHRLFAFFAGAWIGVSLIKFGNPIVLDHLVAQPKGLAEMLQESWPVKWGYLFTFVLLALSIPLFRFRWEPRKWPILFLAVWFFWVLLSNGRSVAPRISNPTIIHFTCCVVVFALGLWGFSNTKTLNSFWVPLILAFGYVLYVGFGQHNGGLEETRKAFYAQPDWQTYPKEFLLKIAKNRIFATLVYPNALAGAIIVFLPVLTWKLWELTASWPNILRAVITGLYGYIGLADLYWTGSKGGWLIALLMAGLFILHLKVPIRLKYILVVAGVILGLTAFAVKFSAYFKKGAPSVGARFVYWQAALSIAGEHPVLGTGPGTFQVPFSKIKAPDEEMAKLVHCDYLEQASDSGIIASLTYLGFVIASFWKLYRYRNENITLQILLLGLFGFAVQSTIEFGLYIPALAWPVFFFLGWLWAEQRDIFQPGYVAEKLGKN